MQIFRLQRCLYSFPLVYTNTRQIFMRAQARRFLFSEPAEIARDDVEEVKFQASPKERTKKWLNLLNCSVEDLPKPKVIHVAGSKGKGTTCYYCNHLLNEYRRTEGAPKNIGCYTSPHQVDIRDRFMINNEKISKRLFTYHVQKLHSKIQALSLQPELETPTVPLYPGFLVLLAIYMFTMEKVDVIVLETGIGGETDSTNVFPHPVATGITTIELDHVQALGNTIEEIAWHKAGIFKAGSPAFAIAQDKAVLDVLRKRAEEIHIAGKLQIVTDHTALEHGLKLNPDMHYQRLNASLAISLANAYFKSEYPHFSITDDIARSLQDAKLPGRAQIIENEDTTWFINVAHSAVSLRETIAWFKQAITKSRYPTAPRVLIFNHGFNKQSPRDPYHLLKVIYESLGADSPMTLQTVIFCTDQLDTQNEKLDFIDFRSDEKVLAFLEVQKRNAEIWEELGGSGSVEVVHTVRDAMRLIGENYQRAEILVTGSSFLASGVLHVLQNRK